MEKTYEEKLRNSLEFLVDAVDIVMCSVPGDRESATNLRVAIGEARIVLSTHRHIRGIGDVK